MKCIIIKHMHIFSFYIFSSVVFLLLVSFIQVMIPEQSFCIHHFCLMLEHKHFPTFLQILCICFEIADQQSFIGRNHNSTASSTRGHLEVWCACLFCFFADIDTTAAAISVIVCLFSFCYLHFFSGTVPSSEGLRSKDIITVTIYNFHFPFPWLLQTTSQVDPSIFLLQVVQSL